MTEKMDSILLIDDDEMESVYNEKALAKKYNDINVVSKLSGTKALSYLTKTEVFPKYILLDINMPQMDGWQFLDNYIKNGWDKKHETKVYMLSCSSATEDLEKMEKYKPLVESYILKPLDKFEIDEKITF